MDNLQDATKKICQLKGEALGMQAMINSILRALPSPMLETVLREFAQESEIGRVVLLNSDQAGEHVLDGFETYFRQVKTIHP